GEGDAMARLPNAAGGAAAGGIAGGILKGGMDALARRSVSRAIPDSAALRRASQAGYEAAEQAGVIVRPEGIQRIAIETVGDLAEFGYHPALQPRIKTILGEMERLA